MRWVLPALLMSLALTGPLFVGSVAAKDVTHTLYALNVMWHLDSATAPEKPTITIDPGDTLRLTIINQDAFDHMFTFPYKSIDVPLGPGATIFVNITTTTSDSGKRQFYCSIPGHTSGTDPNRDGMVGWIQIGAPPPPPPTPSVELLGVLGTITVAFVVVGLRRRRH